MNLLLPLIAFTSIACSQEPSKVYVTNSQPPVTGNCETIRPLTWNCYTHSMCPTMVCNIVYSDNSYRSICTNNPAQDQVICR
jgi:hypothetical protein